MKVLEVLKLIVAAIVLIGLFIYLGSSWFFAEKVLIPAPYGFQPHFKILEINQNQVTLPKNPSKLQFAQTASPGTYLLRWQDTSGEDAYGDLGRILEETNDTVVREFSLKKGSMPSEGTEAQLEIWVHFENPKEDFGMDYEDLRLDGITGKIQAWWIPPKEDLSEKAPEQILADGNTAVMLIHGRRRGEVRETMRIMPTLHELGFPMLSVSYRNHSASDPSPDRLFHYGESEWEDAKTGWDFLKDKGYNNIILYGFSMGGAISIELLKRVNHADVPALIMDSPLLDTRTILKNGGRNIGLPDFFSNTIIFMASQRSGVNYAQLDQRKYAHQLTMPVLLFGAAKDTTVPIELVDEFAEKVKSPLTYKRLDTAEHVEPWNVNPEQYEMWVTEFLKENLVD